MLGGLGHPSQSSALTSTNHEFLKVSPTSASCFARAAKVSWQKKPGVVAASKAKAKGRKPDGADQEVGYDFP